MGPRLGALLGTYTLLPRMDFNSLIIRTDLNTGESEELYRPAEAGAYVKMLSFTRRGMGLRRLPGAEAGHRNGGMVILKRRIALLLALGTLLTGCASGGTSGGTRIEGTDITVREERFLQASATSLLGPRESSTACSEGFIYWGLDHSLVEFDTQTESTAVISPQAGNNVFLSCCCPWEGAVWTVRMDYTEADNSEAWSIASMDYNSGELRQVYVPEDPGQRLDRLTVSRDGELYFTQGELGESRIMRLDPESLALTELTAGDTYYIDSGRLFFTRYDARRDTDRLFYAPLEDPAQTTDTGLDIALKVSMNTPFMYYPKGDELYWSGGTSRLMCLDLVSGESRQVCAFEDSSFVRYFQDFGEGMAVLVREKLPGSGWYQYALYFLDDRGNAKKILDDRQLNQGRLYIYENIDYMAVFPEEDRLLLGVYTPDGSLGAYLVDTQGEARLMHRVGDFDYEAYEQEQMEVESIMQGQEVVR